MKIFYTTIFVNNDFDPPVESLIYHTEECPGGMTPSLPEGANIISEEEYNLFMANLSNVGLPS